jgi:hypothetical protein
LLIGISIAGRRSRSGRAKLLYQCKINHLFETSFKYALLLEVVFSFQCPKVLLEKAEQFPRKENTSDIFFLNRDHNCGKKKQKWKDQTPPSSKDMKDKM